MAKFTVYGRPGCGYCHHAVRLLSSSNLDFDYIDIFEQGMSKADVAEILQRPVHTVPQILHGSHYVGGCMELISYLQSSDFAEIEAAS